MHWPGIRRKSETRKVVFTHSPQVLNLFLSVQLSSAGHIPRSLVYLLSHFKHTQSWRGLRLTFIHFNSPRLFVGCCNEMNLVIGIWCVKRINFNQTAFSALQIKTWFMTMCFIAACLSLQTFSTSLLHAPSNLRHREPVAWAMSKISVYVCGSSPSVSTIIGAFRMLSSHSSSGFSHLYCESAWLHIYCTLWPTGLGRSKDCFGFL